MSIQTVHVLLVLLIVLVTIPRYVHICGYKYFVLLSEHYRYYVCTESRFSLPPPSPLPLSHSLSLSLSLSLSPHTRASLQWGVFVACTEWTVFVCTHTLGHTWKHAFGAAPWWVKMVMDNGNINNIW